MDGIPVLMVARDDNRGLMWSLVGALGDTLMTEGARLIYSSFVGHVFSRKVGTD